MTTEQVNDYIKKVNDKNERQLKVMLDTLEKGISKTKAEQKRLENRLKEQIEKVHCIKDVIMKKLKNQSDRILETTENHQ